MLLCLLVFIAGRFLLLSPISRKGIGNCNCSESSSCILYFSCLCYSVEKFLKAGVLYHTGLRGLLPTVELERPFSQRLRAISVFTLDINSTVIYLIKPGCGESLTLVPKSGTMKPLCSQGLRALWTGLGDSILHGNSMFL